MSLKNSTIVAMSGNAMLLTCHQTSCGRFGFVYEGTFRQAVVYKGRTRDTDWLSMIDKDWPKVKSRLETWLRPENFDQNGRQYKSLREL